MKLPSHFYAIVDPVAVTIRSSWREIMLEAGRAIMQLRLKDVPTRDFLAAARAISQLCHRRDAIFIVNDRADIAMLADADGVHLGQNDLPLDAGRRVLGPDKIIGVSTECGAGARGRSWRRGLHRIRSDVSGRTEEYEGRPRPRSILAQVRAAVKLPIVAIGGITEATIPEILDAGADAAAIITDVVAAPDVGAKIRSILA